MVLMINELPLFFILKHFIWNSDFINYITSLLLFPLLLPECVIKSLSSLQYMICVLIPTKYCGYWPYTWPWITRCSAISIYERWCFLCIDYWLWCCLWLDYYAFPGYHWINWLINFYTLMLLIRRMPVQEFRYKIVFINEWREINIYLLLLIIECWLLLLVIVFVECELEFIIIIYNICYILKPLDFSFSYLWRAEYWMNLLWFIYYS